VTYSNTLNESESAEDPKNTTAILFSSVKALTSSTVYFSTVAGLVFFFNHEIIVDSVLPPLYS